MATKKKAVAKKSSSSAKAPAKAPRFAFKLLGSLPPIDAKRRRIYLRAFSDEQCDAWGDRTKAAAVHAEAERFVGALATTLKKPVVGYSLHRFAWLCQLITELDDAVASDEAGRNAVARGERVGAFHIADKARKRLASGLLAAASGDPAFTKAVTDRNENPTAPHALESTLTGLLQLAAQLRRSDDGELIADDVGLTAEFLSSVSAMTDALREANERTYGLPGGADSEHTNRIEGRVLREMGFALKALRRAKEDGEAITLPVPGGNLSSLMGASSPAVATPAGPTK
ncbi:MAG: hypothetical protein JNJ54_13345 [Myxococcaceae bacterium]|nr:hypothetical protein [Myxococcaceae bacterium]